MTEGMEAITSAALGLALDAASLRQQAIAANIANANVEGYAPVSIDFESQLADARRALSAGRPLDANALADVVPRLRLDNDPGVPGLSPKVRLDVAVADMAQNAVHYQALAKGLAKHYALLAMAVGDGKK